MGDFMKKKKFSISIVIVIFLVFAFVFLGSYKKSANDIVKADGWNIIFSNNTTEISHNTHLIKIYSYIGNNDYSVEPQHLMYTMEERRFLGNSYYKVLTNHACKIYELNQEECITNNFLITPIGKESVLCYGLAPANCDSLYINNVELTLEKRNFDYNGFSHEYVFYYGIFESKINIKNSYYIDDTGEKHNFDLSILYFED